MAVKIKFLNKNLITNFGFHKRFLFTLGFIFVLTSCSSNQWATKLNWTEISLQNLPDSADFPDAHAVVLLDEGKVDVEGSGNVRLTLFDRHKIIRILDEGGLHYANVVIPYHPGSSSVEKIQARTIHQDGRITVLKPEHIFDIYLYPNFIFYADQKAKKFTFPDVEPGDIIEYRYQIVYQNLTLYPSWSFQGFIPVLRSRFEITFPSSVKLHHKVYNFILKPDSLIRPSGFKSVYLWQIKDIPAIIPEPAMPPLSEIASYLLFSPLGFKNWQDVANWYFELSQDRQQPTRQIGHFTRQLILGSQDEIQKLRKIYQWTRDHIRYIAIAIGIGSFQPHYAADVFKNRYGDCKDMVTLMCAMGKAAGLKIYPALVSTKQNGKLDTTLATPLRFNHMIAVAELTNKEHIFMDPTHKGAPFGYVPWYLQNVFVLLIKGNDSFELIKIPSENKIANATSINGEIELKKDGSASCQFNIAITGAPAAQLRAELRPTNKIEQKRWLERYFCRLDYPFDINSFDFIGLKDFRDTITISAKLFLRNPHNHTDYFEIAPGKLIATDFWQLFRAPTRIYPIYFAFKFSKTYRLIIKYPANWKIKNLPTTQNLKDEFGNCTISYHCSKNRLIMNACIQSKKLVIKPEQYKSFRNHIDREQKMIDQPLILKKIFMPIKTEGLDSLINKISK